MKKVLLTSLFLGICLTSFAQKTTNKRLAALEDRAALKEVVDVFSNLADVKNVTAQMDLFTDDAVVETLNNGQPSATLVGKKQISDAFSNFLSLFEIVYHINGQQTVDIQGDKATGTSYCVVTLIGVQNGVKMKNDMGVTYSDTYVKRQGKWLISRRKSNFVWRTSQPMN